MNTNNSKIESFLFQIHDHCVTHISVDICYAPPSNVYVQLRNCKKKTKHKIAQNNNACAHSTNRSCSTSPVKQQLPNDENYTQLLCDVKVFIRRLSDVLTHQLQFTFSFCWLFFFCFCWFAICIQHMNGNVCVCDCTRMYWGCSLPQLNSAHLLYRFDVQHIFETIFGLNRSVMIYLLGLI